MSMPVRSCLLLALIWPVAIAASAPTAAVTNRAVGHQTIERQGDHGFVIVAVPCASPAPPIAEPAMLPLGADTRIDRILVERTLSPMREARHE
jgi:hypothetical protein